MMESVALRIVAIFVILCVSLLGVLIPTALRSFGRVDVFQTPFFRFFRAVSSGVVVSVAYTHILPDAAADLQEITDFPLGHTVALAAALVAMFLEQIGLQMLSEPESEERVEGQSQRQLEEVLVSLPEARHADMMCSTSLPLQQNLVLPLHSMPPSPVHPLCQQHLLRPTMPMTHCTMYMVQAKQPVWGGLHATPVPVPAEPPKQRIVSLPPNSSAPEICEHGHSHDHTRLQMVQLSKGGKYLLKVYLMEVSIAIHSILIGISIGVSDDVPSVRALTIALSFHQFLEGSSLGIAFVDAGWTVLKIVCMGCFFSLTTPAGIAIGLSVIEMNSYNPDSKSNLLAIGLLNSIAAGILIYLGHVEMLADDFAAVVVRKSFKMKCLVFAGVVLGALSMAVLAIWA